MSNSGVFDLQKIELELDTIPVSELQRRINMAEMQVKEKALQIKDLQDMLTVIEAEKDGKMRDIEKLEMRLQEVMVTLKEKQEDLYSMHLSRNLATSEEQTQEMRQQLESLMNGHDQKSQKSRANREMTEKIEMECVEVRCPGRVQERMLFRVTQNFDFHALLLAAVDFFSLRPDGMQDNDIDENFRLVGPKGRVWPLEGRVVEVLRKEKEEWFIEVEPIFHEKAAVVESDVENEIEVVDDTQQVEAGVLFYPPKVSRAMIIYELFMFVAFSTLFLIVLYSARTIRNHQLAYEVHRQRVIENPFGTANTITYRTINTWQEFWDFVEGPLTDTLFPYKEGTDYHIGAPATEVALYNKLVGGIRFNQNRAINNTFQRCGIVSKKAFTRVNNATKAKDYFFDYCYEPYSASTRETGPFGPGKEIQSFFYRRANHTFHIAGDFGTYDNNGFMFNIDDINPDGASFSQAVQVMKEHNWIDLQTRAVQIDYVTYNANFDVFASVFLLVEFTASGFVSSHFVINTFEISLWSGWESGRPSPMSIISAVVFGFVTFYAYQEIREMKMARKITGGLKAYFSQIWNVVDCLIISVYYSTIGCRLWFYLDSRHRRMNLFHYGYTEYYDFARLYSTSFNLDSGVVLLLSFKLFKFFQLSANMAMLWNTLRTAGSSILYFLFMFITILVGFSMMGTSLFGSNLFEYSSFGRTFETLMLMILGSFDYERLRSVNSFWAPFFFALYMVFVVFVLLNIFLAILNEAYGTESARLAEERMLGGAAKMNKLKYLMKIVKASLKERKKAREAARLETLQYQQEMAEAERLEKEGKQKAAALKAAAPKS